MTEYDEVAARRAAREAANAETYFDKSDGLLVQTAAAAVRERVVLGKLQIRRDTDDADTLWHYQDGVWRPGGAREAERIVGSLLGERFREQHVRNVVLALRTAPQLIYQLEEGPPHPGLLNFQNGMLQWADLAFRPDHDPGYASTVQLGVPWEPDAECPVYDGWVRQVLPDEDCVDFLDEVLGYLMFNGNPLHKAIMLKGTGRNGKGTFLRIAGRVLGEWNCSAVPLQRLTDDRFAAVELHMKLANIAGDLDAKYVESTSVFKMVTGQDVITAQRKYGQPFRFTAFAVPIFSANKVPGSADTSQGYLSRWEVVPFPVDLTKLDKGINPSIEEWIVAHELPGVARRGIRGLSRLMARGRFDRPASVAEAFSDFERQVDPIREWRRERTVDDPAGWEPRTPLHLDYTRWAELEGRKPLAASNFYDRLEQAGLKAHRQAGTGTRGFLGIRLVSPTPPAWPAPPPWPSRI